MQGLATVPKKYQSSSQVTQSQKPGARVRGGSEEGDRPPKALKHVHLQCTRGPDVAEVAGLRFDHMLTSDPNPNSASAGHLSP